MMHDLDTIIRLNEEAAARELGRSQRVRPASTEEGFPFLAEVHPGRKLSPEDTRRLFTIIKGGRP